MSTVASSDFDFFLLRTDATSVRLVSNRSPLTFERLVEEFDFLTDASNDIGHRPIPTKDGVYLLWCETAGPHNATAEKLFSKLERRGSHGIQNAVRTGNVAITFHKFHHTGVEFEAGAPKKLQVALPFKDLRKLLTHMNEPTGNTYTRKALYDLSRPRFLWSTPPTVEEETYFVESMECAWNAITEAHARIAESREQERIRRDEALLQRALSAMRAWEELDRVEEAAHSSAEPAAKATSAPVTTPSAFLAKLAAESAVRSGEKCPIGLDSLATYETVCVPMCGHVCGPDAAGLDKCPVCRTSTGWASVPVTT